MRIDLMGCPVDALTMAQTLDRVGEIVDAGVPRQHMALNSAKLVEMCRQPELRRAVRSSAIINADGAGIVYAARFLGQPVPERVAGCDLMQELLRACPERGWRPYFLGARPEVVQRVADLAVERYAGIDLAGWRDGYFPPSADEEVAHRVRDSGAHLLFVALPSPRKETFLARWLDVMQVPFCMGVGGSFDVMAGRLERAPPWMQRLGLEWAHRLALEPRRIWKRAFVGTAVFGALVVQARLTGFRVPGDAP